MTTRNPMGNNHGMTPGYIARAEEQRLAALDWERYNAKKAAMTPPERCICLEIIGNNGTCPVHGPGFDPHEAITQDDLEREAEERRHDARS